MIANRADQLTAVRAGDTPLGPIAESLALTVLGTAGGWAPNLPCGPQILRAFAPGSDLSVVEVGEGLWSALRTSADGLTRVLCVHNLGERSHTFDPSGVLPQSPRGEFLHFVHGHMRTPPSLGGEVLCALGAHEFVWLARFGAERSA